MLQTDRQLTVSIARLAQCASHGKKRLKNRKPRCQPVVVDVRSSSEQLSVPVCADVCCVPAQPLATLFHGSQTQRYTEYQPIASLTGH